MKCIMTMVAAVLTLAVVAQDKVEQKSSRVQSATPAVMAVLNPKIAEKIGLSEEQMTKLKVLKNENSKSDAFKTLQEKVRSGTARQAELLKASPIDEAAVMAAIDSVFEARREIAKLQTKRVIAVLSILTPEQIKNLVSLKKPARPKKVKAKE